MRKIRHFLSLLLALTMGISMAACGDKGDVSTQSSSTTESFVASNEQEEESTLTSSTTESSVTDEEGEGESESNSSTTESTSQTTDPNDRGDGWRDDNIE